MPKGWSIPPVESNQARQPYAEKQNPIAHHQRGQQKLQIRDYRLRQNDL